MFDQLLLCDLVETMFATDVRGRLVGSAPHLHIVRTPDIVICRCHAKLGDEIADTIVRLAQHTRGRPAQWAREYAGYLRALAQVGPFESIRAGPIYSFPEQPADRGGTVSISESNADLLLNGLDEWKADVAVGLPMIAMVVDGRAVSVCASVNAPQAAHCAGVETLPEYRGRGLAVRVVEGWAHAVQASGALPFYGTTFDNVASQCVAKRLGLNLIGGEFSVKCEAN